MIVVDVSNTRKNHTVGLTCYTREASEAALQRRDDDQPE